MIRSMTAFARAEAELGPVRAVWELRTVNHRYLDIRPRLPEDYRFLDPTVRERAQIRLERGKLDTDLRLETGGDGAGGLTLDADRARALVELGEQVRAELGTAGALATGELLAWPGVVQTAAPAPATTQQALADALDAALDKLVAGREREGEAMEAAIRSRLEAMDGGLDRVRERLPEVRTAFRQRLADRLGELGERLDSDRLEQEMVLATQRMDVDEETDRLATHIQEVGRILEEGGACGRRLDFLFQEMQREVNTIGSKSPDAAIGQTVVDMKVLVEQLREQAQNIE